MNPSSPDWDDLLSPYRDQSVFSTETGQQLLTELIGDEQIASAVDYYIASTGTAGEALRSALGLVKPAVATSRCLDLMWADGPDRERQRAADLLQVVCRPSDVDAVEALLNDEDSVRQQSALRIMSTLQWSVDLDTDQICRITRRCFNRDEVSHRRLGLSLAVASMDEILERDLDEGQGRLTVGEVQSMFEQVLTSGDPQQVEVGLGACPDFLIGPLSERLAALAAHPDARIAELAHEIIVRRPRVAAGNSDDGAPNEALWSGHPLFEYPPARVLRTPSFWWDLYQIEAVGETADALSEPGNVMYRDRISPLSTTAHIWLPIGAESRRIVLEVEVAPWESALKVRRGTDTTELARLDGGHPSPHALRWKEARQIATYLEENFGFPTSPRLGLLLLCPFLAITDDDDFDAIRSEVAAQLAELNLLSPAAIDAVLRLTRPMGREGDTVKWVKDPEAGWVLDRIEPRGQYRYDRGEQFAKLLRYVGVDDVEPAAGWPEAATVLADRLRHNGLRAATVESASALTSDSDLAALVAELVPGGRSFLASQDHLRSRRLIAALRAQELPLVHKASEAFNLSFMRDQLDGATPAVGGGLDLPLFGEPAHLFIFCVDADQADERDLLDEVLERIGRFTNDQGVERIGVLIIEGPREDFTYG